MNKDYEKMTREELIRELQLLSVRRQATPHFLFNSISVAISLVMQEPKTAVTFLRQVANMYRYLLYYGNEYAVPIEQELEMVLQYFDLMCLRYVGSLKLSIDEEVTHLKSHLIPPLTLQGLMENAIKHNAHSPSHPLEIHLSVESCADGNYLCVSNPISPVVSESNSTKRGLEYMNQSLRLLYKKELKIFNDGKTFIVKMPLLT